MGEMVIFLAFAFIAVVTGIGVIFSRNAVYSALLLVANFFCLTVFYVLLNAQFLAAVQLTVYAGAIMVLFVFVIMLLSPTGERSVLHRMRGQGLLALPLALIFIAQVVVAVAAGTMSAERGPYTLEHINELGGSVQAVGRVLFTDYLLPFEMTSLLLVVALIGAVVLGKRRIS
jgi:NADH-quinone oxidoreductase subunit J